MQDRKDFQQELKYQKFKLHTKYIIGISVIITAIVIVAAGYNDGNFVEKVSFAGTIASIILSVIAIIMTIVGESKSENTKDKLINLSEDLEEIVCKIEKTTDNLESVVQSNYEVKSQLSSIGSVIQDKYLAKQEAALVESEINENREMHNCYIFMFEEAAKSLNHIIFKDMCITLLYIGARALIGTKEVLYEEYISDNDKLNLNIASTNLAWTISFIFVKATWTDKQFMSYIFDYCKNKYNTEVASITSYIENSKEKE